MKEFLEKLSEMQKGILLSVAVHILLLFLFLLLHSGIKMPDSGFAEVGFISATTSSRSYSPAKPANPPKATETVQTQASMQKESQPEAQPEKVKVPKRRMLEDEEPKLSKRSNDKITPPSSTPLQVPHTYKGAETGKEIADHPSHSGSGKDFSLPGGNDQSGKDITGPQSPVNGSGSASPFTIEGDASKRQIVNQVIPQYPSGLQKEAVVKIRFTVLPDGRVGQMIPLQKGDPTLERISMEAMRQWRFNALAPGVEQQNVTGIITFRYKLQ